MGTDFRTCRNQAIKWCLVFVVALVFGLFVQTHAQAFTVNVVDQDGNPVSGFKWLLEEDNTHLPEPGVHKPVSPNVEENTLSISIHKSHAPVVASGESTGSSATINSVDLPGGTVPLTPGRYFVSVLPFGNRSSCDGTYDMGGAPIDTRTQAAVTVYVRQNPIETAQISVKVFHDIAPLNNSPDVTEIDPENSGNPNLLTMEGFTVTITDQGGDIVQDIFGNILGTTYARNFDGTPILDPVTCEPQILQLGTGDFVTPPNGEVFIRNLLPGKYGVEVEPPTTDPQGNPITWHQVTTIEGTKTIDAWVRPNEPPFSTIVQPGIPFWHVFVGFVQEMDLLGGGGPTATTVTGQIAKGHLSRPPAIAFSAGPPPEGEAVGERCLIGLNSLQAGFNEAVWVGKCEDGTGNFSIPNVPPGTYQLVIWDISLLHIITFNTVITADTGGALDLGILTTPMWFGQHEHYVFSDDNKNAFRDAGEAGIPEQNVNLRFRDGSVYQAFPTDTEGFVPFQSVFPFFHWQVAEVDFARQQATGLTVVVDDGGQVTNDEFGEGKRNPQLQATDGSDPANVGTDSRYRTEQGVVLTEAYQIFATQNTRFEWGKAPYDGDVNAVDTSSEAAYFASIGNWPNGAGDVDTCTQGAEVPVECADSGSGDGVYNNNGGISGIVFYAVTRAEDDPRLAAGETWEPGIPRVQVNLYRDNFCSSNGGPAVFPACPEATPGEVGDGIPDDRNGNGVVDYADVDNPPFGWRFNPAKLGPEDIDRNANGVFDRGDALSTVRTDSWDYSLPEGCRANFADNDGDGIDDSTLLIHGQQVPISQCAEGLRTYNQVRPGVFDGGYAFGPELPWLVPGTYIVEAATPPGYKLVKEEDRNVDFGTIPIPALLPAKCVGDDRVVPPLFSFLTDQNGNPLPGVDPNNPDNQAPFAGETRPLCDRKKVDLGTGQNAAADFFLFTDVPKAARGVGTITDDLANELAPGKPSFTEKFAPSWLSIAVFDYTGKEIFRTYADEFGAYNFLGPGHYNVNPPTPSGIGPKMHQFCLNHPGPIEDPPGSGRFVTDPRFRPQYSTSCFNFNFETGKTTYLDTPVLRTAAFVGALQTTLDCEQPNGQPVIRDVVNLTTGEPAVIRAGQQLRIRSMRQEEVRNPDFPGGTLGNPADPPTEPEFITRNHNFGAPEGTVCVDAPTTAGPPDFCFDPADVAWNAGRIIIDVTPAHIAAGLTTGQLSVIRANGNTTQVGVTLTVNPTETIRRVPSGYPTIQAAIDAANPGDLILVDPGEYFELPIVYKRVKLQGAGAGSTKITATHFSTGPSFVNPLVAWRDKVAELVAGGQIGLLPEQDPNVPDLFLKDGEGPGFFVSPLPGLFDYTGDREDLTQRARIDGFRIQLAELGGAIYANAYANRLLVSNNRISSNEGNLAGGIRIGNPSVVVFPRGGVAIADSPNPGIDVRHNQIDQNGSLSTGGGIALYRGARNYRIEDNFMCGNFARSGGGGIAHRGYSNGGQIAYNAILFNEVFQGNQPGAGLGVGGGGGGIEVAGDPDVAAGGLTEGTGNVTINANLIQGNLGGSEDGGGIGLRNVNGQDVAASPGNPNAWHQVNVFNNLIANNVSGNAGGGIALQDAARVKIVHNTIAHNDSTSTSVFAGIATGLSTPQPAGIVARAHSNGLQAILGPDTYSAPLELRRNIFWENRSFLWDQTTPSVLIPNPDGSFWDLGVLGTANPVCSAPSQSVLTSLTPPADPAGCDYSGSFNQAADPLFVSDYFNELIAAVAADEGGNFVQVYYTPLGQTGNYHIRFDSPAVNARPNSGVAGLLSQDVDGEPRPQGVRPDTGADENR